MTPPKESEPESDEEDLPSIEEMRNALLGRLYRQRDSLNGMALVNGLKALAMLVQQDKAEPEKPEDSEPHSLLDQIKNVPAAHARKLLTAELARLGSETAAHKAALDALEGK